MPSFFFCFYRPQYRNKYAALSRLERWEIRAALDGKRGWIVKKNVPTFSPAKGVPEKSQLFQEKGRCPMEDGFGMMGGVF